MNQLVLSGTPTHVPSGTRSSCHRGPESEVIRWQSVRCARRNFPNLESFGFLLTDAASSTARTGTRSAALSEGKLPVLTGVAGLAVATLAAVLAKRTLPKAPDVVVAVSGDLITTSPHQQTELQRERLHDG